MQYYFTSDFHLQHKRIIEFSKRPFANVEEMDEAIIKNWNSRITNQDCIYFLGDFAFSNAAFVAQTIRRLNGRILFIRGNHEQPLEQFFKGIKGYPDIWPRVEFLGDYKEVTINGQVIILCHYPFLIWNKKHYNSWCLAGHSQYNLPATRKEATAFGKVLDVGVDGNNFMPYSFDEIVEIMKNKPMMSDFVVIQDHHGSKN